MATTNLNLDKVTTAQTVNTWVNYFNGNMDKLDAFPIPIASGSNSSFSYVKLANGVLVMWGHFEDGDKPCYQAWAEWGGSGYASDRITVTYPVPTVDEHPAVFVSGRDSSRAEIMALVNDITATSARYFYWAPTQASTASQGSKSADILIIGRWA